MFKVQRMVKSIDNDRNVDGCPPLVICKHIRPNYAIEQCFVIAALEVGYYKHSIPLYIHFVLDGVVDMAWSFKFRVAVQYSNIQIPNPV